MSPRSARVAVGAWSAIKDEVLARYPHEACGVLLGRSGETLEILEARPAPNVDQERARDRYLLDPRSQLNIEKEARVRRLDVLGYFHSHPDHPSQASATDLERSWEGFLYLIVSVRLGKVADAKAWFRSRAADGFGEMLLDGTEF
ncbi:MAG: Mov34/MPN/PAD-1 family protein [bacterium]